MTGCSAARARERIDDARLRRLLAIAALPFLIQAAPPPAEDPREPAAPAGAVRVTIETLAVDRRGTWSLGADVAEIFSDSTGVLKKSATLLGRGAGSGAREMVEMTARLTPTLERGGGCALRIEAETRGAVAGAAAGAKPRRPDRVRATIVLKPAEERLVEAYSSTTTQGRLALKVRCEPAGAEPGETPGSETRFVDFLLSVSRADGDEDLRAMKSNGLRAMLGREASDLFSFNVPLETDRSGAPRYRREKLEVTLTPTVVSAGRVQVQIGVRGELATVGADTAPVIHPIEHADMIVVAPGEAREVDIDVRSGGPGEGWARVRYRLSVVGTF